MLWYSTPNAFDTFSFTTFPFITFTPVFISLFSFDAFFQPLFAISIKLEGLNRKASTLAAGLVINQVEVDIETKINSKIALDRMINLPKWFFINFILLKN